MINKPLGQGQKKPPVSAYFKEVHKNFIMEHFLG